MMKFNEGLILSYKQIIMSNKKKPEQAEKREAPIEKTRLHKKNKHRERYDFKKMIAIHPALSSFVLPNKYGDESIDFSNPAAVRTLNTSLLMTYYDIQQWDLPDGYLCPPIPGRADYIHHVADILAQKNFGKVPSGSDVHCLDVGVGASCIYPIIGVKEYGWQFVGSDIQAKSLASAQDIVNENDLLKGKVSLRLQPDAKRVFQNVIEDGEYYDLTLCNPPFHASAEDAKSGSDRKIKNLKLKKSVLNFGGQENELWCDGGEDRFVQSMITESKGFATVCLWFTTLISKQSNLKRAYQTLERIGAFESRTIPMGQGNKTSRILAWTFHNMDAQKEWASKRWSKV